MGQAQKSQERGKARAFYEAHIAGARPPLTFTYGGTPSSALLPGWPKECETRRLNERASEHRVTYTDPQTALQVRCTCVVYADYPAIEWVVTFRLRLRGLDPQAHYELDLEGEPLTLTGVELSRGLEVTLAERPGSLLVTYRRQQHP